MSYGTKPKSLRARAIQYMLNKLGLFEDSCVLSHENVMLRNQLFQYGSLSQENHVLREQLSHYQQQTAEKMPFSQPSLPQNPPSQSSFQQPVYMPTDSNKVSGKQEPSHTSGNQHEIASQYPQESEEDAALLEQVAQYRQQHAVLLERYAKLNEEMKRKKIDSFEALAEQDKEAYKILLELARLTPPVPMEGKNIGLFGSTSTGKSTMLNTILGNNAAKTGVGETTMEITPYQGKNYTLWDVPGRNDEISYLSMEYISFFKGLSRRLVLIQATVKENSSMMKLLDEVGLRYDIVFNKFDKVDEEERAELQKQIREETKKLSLKGVDQIYFVSAKYPNMFPDWITMMNCLEHIENTNHTED